MHTRACVMLVAFAIGACGPDREPFPTDDAAVDGASNTDGSTGDAPTPPPDTTVAPIDASHDGPDPSLDMTIVYAHSDTTLYAVDPRTDALRTVGTFAFPAGDTHRHAMTDLAVDAMGRLVGVTGDGLFRIDASTAACTVLATLPGMHQFVGLTYVPVGVLDPASEVLVGGATDGSYWRIDPSTGVSTQLGQFQGGWGLSGDIVSIAGAATYATVRRTGATSGTHDMLATIDPRTGAVTLVGDTGFSQVFGLGYWRATLFGFTRSGEFIRVDASTGRGRLVSTPTTQFSGAGVTTVAPITPG